MKPIRKFVTTMAMAGLVLACNDSTGNGGDGGTTLADLEGNYTATQFQYASVADPTNVNIDLVAVGGAVTVDLAADGSFSATLQLPGGPVVPFTGTISISGSTLTLTPATLVVVGPITLDPADPFVFDSFTLSGNQLTLSSSDVTFDFTLGACGTDPCPEIPATLVLVLNR